jgi:FkbM family methyltransferase
MSDFSQEVRKCNCTAPSSLTAFGGDFLEIGAADGLYLSNTAFFEYQMNWKGVCIEASPASFQKLRQNRPNCHAVNAVVGREFNGKNSTFLTILKYNSWEIGMSGMLGGKGMLHSIESAQEYAKKVGGTLQVDQVPGILLSDVYDRAGISKIDYASIDVEGAEEAVLKTWNTSKVPVGLLDSEHKAIEHVIKDWGLEKMNGPLIDVWYKSKNGFPL